MKRTAVMLAVLVMFPAIVFGQQSFKDNFEDLDAWEVISGDWHVEDNALIGYWPLSDAYGVQGNIVLKNSVFKASSWVAEYEFTYNDGYAQAVGMSFIDTENYVVIGISYGHSGWDGAPMDSIMWYMWGKKNGISKGVFHGYKWAYIHWDPKEWNKVRLEKRGNQYKLYFNGTFIGADVDTSLNGAGQFGFHVYGPCKIRNLSIMELDEGGSVELAGQWSDMKCRAVEVSGNYAYVAAFENGLRIIDVSDPANPREVGYLDTKGCAYKVYVFGGYVYVGDCKYPGTPGLRIVDVSDPTNPQEVGSLDLGDCAMDVVVSDGYAYVCDQDEGFKVIDIHDLTSPRVVASVGGYAHCVKLVDKYAYVTDAFGGLRVFDIRKPLSPQQVSSLKLGSWLADMEVSGQYMYIAGGKDGLWIVDISDPSNPVQVGHYDTPGTAWDVSVAGKYAYIADAEGGLRVVDVSDVTNPQEVDHFDTGEHTIGVWVYGRYAYVAAADTPGLYILKITSEKSVEKISVAVRHSVVTKDELVNNLRSDGVPDELIAKMDKVYVYRFYMNGGGGYYSDSLIKLLLGKKPEIVLGKGESDAQDGEERAAIGVDKENLHDFNGQGWVDLTEYAQAKELFLRLNSKWGSDKDTYIWLWMGFSSPLDETIYYEKVEYPEGFGELELQAYQVFRGAEDIKITNLSKSLEDALKADGASAYISKFRSEDNIYRLHLVGGGGYHSHCVLKTYLDAQVKYAVAWGKSDARDEYVRAGVGKERNHLVNVQDKWVEVTDEFSGKYTDFILDSKWGSDHDTEIIVWLATEALIKNAQYAIAEMPEGLQSITLQKVEVTPRVVSLPDTLANPGDTLRISLSIDDAKDIAGIEATISFDSEVLEAIDVDSTSLTKDFTLADTVSPGQVRFSLARATGLEGGSGALAEIIFKVVGSPGDSTGLVLDKIALYDENTEEIPASGENGSVKVVSAGPVRIEISPDTAIVEIGKQQEFSCKGYDSEGKEVSVTPTWEVEPSELGGITSEGLFSGTGRGKGLVIAEVNGLKDSSVVWVGEKGDVNLDGIVDVRDGIICLRLVAGLLLPPKPLHEATVYEKWASDISRDGEVTAGDALLILYKGLGRPVPKIVMASGIAYVMMEEEGGCSRLVVEGRRDIYAAEVDLRVGMLREVRFARDGIMKVVNDRGDRVRVVLVGLGGILGDEGEMLEVLGEGIKVEKVRLFGVSGQELGVLLEGREFGDLSVYPNPFNGVLHVRYVVGDVGKVGIYDVLGRLVRDWRVGFGEGELEWDGRDRFGRFVSSGVYFVRLEVGDISRTKKVVFVR